MNYKMLNTGRRWEEEGREGGGQGRGGQAGGGKMERTLTSWEPVPLWADPHACTPPPPSLGLFSCDSSRSGGGWEDWEHDRAASRPRCVERCGSHWARAAAARVGGRSPSGLKSSSFEFFRERKTAGKGPTVGSGASGGGGGMLCASECALKASWECERRRNSEKQALQHFLFFSCTGNILSLQNFEKCVSPMFAPLN